MMIMMGGGTVRSQYPGRPSTAPYAGRGGTGSGPQGTVRVPLVPEAADVVVRCFNPLLGEYDA